MEGNIKLSIIIPVYNVADYIQKCVLSIEQQDIPHQHYEVIAVNDGSTDYSRERILELANQFNNILLIDQENKGVSAARNAGMDKAKGKYILFVDGDDCIEKNSFSNILALAEKNQLHILMLGYKVTDVKKNETISTWNFAEEKNKLFSGIEVYHQRRKYNTGDPDSSCAILYKRSFIENNAIRFTPGIPYLEDGEFISRVFCLAERCMFEAQHSFYIRTIRPGSATQGDTFFSDKAITGFFNAINSLKNFQNLPSLSKAQQHFVNQPIVKYTLLTIQATAGRKLFYKYKKIKQTLLQKNHLKLQLRGCSWFYYKYGFLYNISIDLFYTVWCTRLMFLSMKNKTSALFKYVP